MPLRVFGAHTHLPLYCLASPGFGLPVPELDLSVKLLCFTCGEGLEVGDSPLPHQSARAEQGGQEGLWALDRISLRQRGLYPRGMEEKNGWACPVLHFASVFQPRPDRTGCRTSC